MINYLYYKLYKAVFNSNLQVVPSWIASTILAVLFILNILTINTYFSKIDVLPYWFSDNDFLRVLMLVLAISFSLYFSKKKRKLILKKYSKESEKQRISGNLRVCTYVILTIIALFLVAFYKPGKL